MDDQQIAAGIRAKDGEAFRELVATHGPGLRSAWSGDPANVDAWWPVALDAWREALRARVATGPHAAVRT